MARARVGSHNTRCKFLDTGEPNPNYVRHGGKGGRKLSLWKRKEFVAWDGEGHTPPGCQEKDSMGLPVCGDVCSAPDEHLEKPQSYVLLCNSRGEHLARPEGMTCREALDFLCDAGERHPHAIHVGFAFSYDVNQILRKEGLDFFEARQLWRRPDDGMVVWEPAGVRGPWYHISYLNRKEFFVGRTRYPHYREKMEDGELKVVPNYCGTIRIWDVFSFFQSTFMDALELYVPDYKDLELIRAGKELRPEFRGDQEFIESVLLPYCQAECEALESIMRALREDVEEVGVTLRRWDGAGALAGALLEKHQVKHAITQPKPALMLACRHAYFGGRMEMVRFGTHRGGIRSYDIASAYPHAMLDLPDLTRGRWYHHKNPRKVLGKEPSCLVLYRIEWDLKHASKAPFYPFGFRERTGAIRYPERGAGWVYACELQVAMDQLAAANHPGQLSGEILVHEAWAFHPDEDAQDEPGPFAFVSDLYEQRRAWEEEGFRAARVLKLGLTSLYGKLIQRVGGRRDLTEYWRAIEEGREERKLPPPYFSLPWAGYITAKTRARVYEMAMMDPAGLVMFATDAVFTTNSLQIPKSNALGGVREERANGGVFVQPGVYFVDHGQDVVPKYRGYDPDSFTIQDVQDGWEKGEDYLSATCSRPVGYGTATTMSGRFREWGVWKTVPRDLALLPEGKRLVGYGQGYWQDMDVKKLRAHRRLVNTAAKTSDDYEHGLSPMSYPYYVNWLDVVEGAIESDTTIDGVEAHVALGEWEDGWDD